MLVARTAGAVPSPDAKYIARLDVCWKIRVVREKSVPIGKGYEGRCVLRFE